MTDAVAVAEPGRAKTKSSKPLLAGALVFLLLVAFATAFYFLGGIDLVSGLIGQFFAAAPAPSAPPSSGQKPGAPAVVPTSPAQPGSTAMNLPPGVDEAFAKRMYVEQLESEANITKLVDGKVKSFAFEPVSTSPDGTEVPLKAQFSDKTSGKGVLGLAQRQGSWYFVFIRGERGAATGGEADSVAGENDEGFVSNEHAGQLDSKPVDVDVLNTILAEQLKSQDVFKAIVDGTYTGLTVDKVTAGAGTATLDVTLSGPKAAAMKGRILCISKDIDGANTWFVTSFTKA